MDVRELYRNGMSIAETARQFRLNWKTAARWVKSSGTPRYKRASRPSILDPYKDYITARMDEGCELAVVLLDEIRQMGYTGRTTVLKDFMQPRRRRNRCQAVERFETEPGEQTQVDWVSFGRYVDEYGMKKTLYAFLMVMSYSRKLYLEFVHSTNMGTWLQCHIHAFEYFGGVTRTILYDNLKTAVDRIKENGDPVLNSRFLDFADHYGFTIKTCRPYRAQTGGKVERPGRYLKENFWVRKDTVFNSLEEVNILATRWREEAANKRVHGTTHEVPNERFKKEREYLMSISQVVPFDVAVYEKRKVSRDFYVTYLTNSYSVSPRYVGKQVDLRVANTTLTILYDGKQIEEYPLLKGQHKVLARTKHEEEARQMHKAAQHPVKRKVVRTPAPEVEVRDLSFMKPLPGKVKSDEDHAAKRSTDS